MLLRAILAGTVVSSMLGISTMRPSTPAACTLVTAQEASTAAGAAVTLAPDVKVTSPNCEYYGAGGPAALAVAIAMHAYADDAAAHAAFPKWVLPYPGPHPTLTVTAQQHIGDEASITRSQVSSGIFFRRGSVLVKIGVHPPVGDAALIVLAKKAVSRM